MKKEESCANCKYLLELMKHPWNKTIGKGRISEKLGYVCTVPLAIAEGFAVFFDEDFGGCELHERIKSM